MNRPTLQGARIPAAPSGSGEPSEWVVNRKLGEGQFAEVWEAASGAAGKRVRSSRRVLRARVAPSAAATRPWQGLIDPAAGMHVSVSSFSSLSQA